MDQLLFAPLVAPQSRWKAFLTGWGVQVFAVAVLLTFNALFPQAIPQAKKYVVTNLVAYEPPVVTEAQPVNPRLTVKIKPVPLPVVETPTVAKLVVPAPVRKRVEPEPDIKAPEIKTASKLPQLPEIPKAPVAKVVATNTFAQPTNIMPTTAKPAALVQTGGFGDPNGVAARDGKGAANIAAKGVSGLPTGPGFGNGLGGAKGTAGVGIVGNGVVQSSGFDKQAAAPVRKVETAVSNGPRTPVEIISKPKPDYTEEGRNLRIEGEVRLEVMFTANGQAHVVKVLQGLGYGLDEQALRCAEQIKFKPAMHDGQRVDSTAVVHIIFELAS